MRSGLARIDIPEPDGLEDSCHKLVEAASLDTGFLFLQITRGSGPRAHLPPKDLEPTVLILPSTPVYDPPAGRQKRVVTCPDWRWQHCDLKTTSLMATVLGKLRARDAEMDEVVFVGSDGEVREGGSTNLFVRRNDTLETHPLNGRILAGVTRACLLELAAAADFPVEERAPRWSERDEWQEAFLCGTLTGVQPVTELDGQVVAGGAGGPWTKRLAEDYASLEESTAKS